VQCAFSVKQRLSQPENLQRVSDLLRRDPTLTRAQLSQELCRQLDLRDPKGDWQIATTARALRELEAQGRCQLPQPTVAGGREWSPTRLDHAVPAPSGVPRVAGEVRGLRLVEVEDREHLQIWNELMLREHPLQEARLVGRQLRYLVGSEHGWLGGIGFGSAALYLGDRDEWIGWTWRISHSTGSEPVAPLPP